MMNGSRRLSLPPVYQFLVTVQGIVLVVAALHFAQPVLLPLVTAILLTFVLRPAVVWLERHSVPRAVAVATVVLSILLVIGGAGWMITRQFGELALHLDEYRGHMREKIELLHQKEPKTIKNVRAIFREITEAADSDRSKHAAEPPGERPGPSSDPPGDDFAGQPATSADPAQNSDSIRRTPEPQAVKVVPEPPSPVAILRVLWGSLSTPLAGALIVSVLVLFILSEYEELRNRIYRLAGQTKLTVTTRALDEAGKRISRYLAAYALVNGGFGILIFGGLWLIGVRYALLWGFLAGTFRFLPYIGVIAAAGLPLGMAVIQFPDWTHPALVAGLFVVVELATNGLVEPLTYGKSAGVSTVALLVAATFWTWIWGPMGLLLSVPLTVVLAVLGKYVSQFESRGILLGDGPALPVHVSFYQRLLADDANEAAAMFAEQLATHERAAVYDDFVVPALALAERDRHLGALDQADRDFVWRNAAELIEENAPAVGQTSPRRITVAGCACDGLADELALVMLHHIVPSDCELVITGSHVMASEKIAVIARTAPQAVIISAVGQSGDLHVRYLCKRIRHQSPRIELIVGSWGYRGNHEQLITRLKECGADHVVTTFDDALNLITRIPPIPPVGINQKHQSHPAPHQKKRVPV